MSSNNNWNDEVMRIEAMSNETNQPSAPMEGWDWQWKAEQAESKIKQLEHELDKFETLLEHAKTAIFQIRENNNQVTKKTCVLLMMCAEQLELADPIHFYANLDANPLVRKRQLEDRLEARREVIEAVRYLVHEVNNISAKNAN